jgi:peptidoglycan/LPS O-acetylase OafA/YrhL
MTATPAPRIYIDHLDGIRCLAVTLVVLFHAKQSLLPGGFIGVDVFFVLSGYLMTRILCGKTLDLDGLKAFFASRGRRILPAYLATLAVCAVVSALLMLPVHVKGIAASLAAAPLFLSNFVFWKTTDYFSQDLAYNPLLHTWSLAVEWQFYMLYPLLFLALRRHRRLIPWAIVLCGLLSYAVAHVFVARSHTIFSFYLLPTRMWEFIAGGLLVFAPALPANRWAGRALGWSGLLLVLGSAVFYSSKTPFPGAAALLPCLGAALLIHAGGAPGMLNRLLTWRPIDRIGKYSYSIYLWHWPLIVFSGYAFAPGHFDDQLWYVPAIAGVSVLLGYLSWKYIEAPFRRPPGEARPAPRWPRPAVAGLTSFCIAMGAWMFASEGLPFRFSPEVAALSNAYKDAGEFRDCLSRSPPNGGGAGSLCRLGAPAAPVTFLMLGDSHGAALADGVSHLATAEGLAGVLSVSDACAPLLDFPGNYLPSRARCEKAQRAIPHLVDSLRPTRVVLHAAWGGYHRRDPARFERVLAQTLDAFAARGVQVVIVGDTPGARDNVPINLAKAAAFGTRIDLAWPAHEVRLREDATERLLREQAARRSFTYVDIDDRLCEGGECRLVAAGLPLYWDQSHLTGRGSRWVAALVGPELLGRGAAPPASGLGLAAAVRAN